MNVFRAGTSGVGASTEGPEPTGEVEGDAELEDKEDEVDEVMHDKGRAVVHGAREDRRQLIFTNCP